MHQKQKLTLKNKSDKFILFFKLIRPHTLPLAISGVICSAALAYALGGRFCLLTTVLLFLTAVFLQILSNLANDYGDMIKGTDIYRDKTAPKRLVHQGKISKAALKLSLLLTLFLSLISGFWLLWISLLTFWQWLLFLMLGVLSLVAAITYTVGKYAYGYIALGEIAVILFFGLIAVAGGFYLQAQSFDFLVLLPSFALGLLCAGVLHINNIRDLEGDTIAGKITLANLLGFKKSKLLHIGFIAGAVILYALFILISQLWGGFLFFLSLPQIFKHIRTILKAQDSPSVGLELKTMVLLTFWITVYFSFGVVLTA